MNREAKSILRLVRPVLGDDLDRVGRSYGRVEPYGGDQAGTVLHLAAAMAGPGSDGGAITGRGLLREIESRPGRRVTAWLARADDAADRPVGLVSLVAAGPAGAVRHSIGWLLVDPGHRRRGVGTALVHVALTEAGRDGATEVWVETHAAWPAATAFWQRLGFMPP
jgi:GNAT superfamily N-acetyltransferase